MPTLVQVSKYISSGHTYLQKTRIPTAIFTSTSLSIQRSLNTAIALEQEPTELLRDFRWEHSRGECSPKDGRELLVQTTDAHLREIPVGVDDAHSTTAAHTTRAPLYRFTDQ